MPSRPYALSRERVRLSPFATVEKARDALARYQRGESIGFTYVSSLKAMGILPRANGQYQLGPKYLSASMKKKAPA
ncbi:hypothetical protein EBZ80_14565 [bacterium]|nr:hypothetical protein [bacterium]